MIEVVYFPIHGQKRGGTGNAVYGGFGYGNAKPDPVTLKPDRPTDLFAPSLSEEVEGAGRVTGKSILAPHVRSSGPQPATVALSKGEVGIERARKAATKERSAASKAQAQVAKIQKAIMAGRMSPKKALAKAQRAAEHGLRMRAVAHEAYNSIAILQARIRQEAAAGAPGKSLAAHQRVLNKMREHADRLEAIAARDQALHAAVAAATGGGGLSDYIQLEGLGEEPVGDARDTEQAAAELIAKASDELAAGNVAGAEVTIANAEGAFQQANKQMSAEQAAGDVFAQVTEALEPDRIPWGMIGAGILIVAALRQATR